MTENLAVSSPGKPPLSMPVIRQILFARLDLRKGPVAGLPLLAELPKQIPNRIRQQKTPRSDLLPRATPTSFILGSHQLKFNRYPPKIIL